LCVEKWVVDEAEEVNVEAAPKKRIVVWDALRNEHELILVVSGQ
jgi:hypothetical protein